MAGGVNVISLYGQLYHGANEALADVDWKKRRAVAVKDFVDTRRDDTIKDALKTTELYLRTPTLKNWVEEKTDLDATFTPLSRQQQLHVEGVGGHAISVAKNLVVGQLKTSNNVGVKSLGWFLQGAEAIRAIRAATPIGAALEAAFLARDLVDLWADMKVESIVRAVTETIDELNIRRHEDFSAVEDDAMDALRETDPTTLRQGGWRGALFTAALQAKAKDPDIPTSVVYEYARPYFRWKFVHISDCILRISIDAFCLNAWSELLAAFARQPGDNALWGAPKYNGFVDLAARRRFATSAGSAAQRLRRACLGRLDELADEFSSAEAWLMAWTSNP